ncbi:hypothetical protein GOODEAATRI_026172 [Goodea atripinnis]|uniref:Uncharacterized protein n=1 Tax=Goodea atripinnis TaxID=208336 RepID=A0ABV0PS67_9TELE
MKAEGPATGGADQEWQQEPTRRLSDLGGKLSQLSGVQVGTWADTGLLELRGRRTRNMAEGQTETPASWSRRMRARTRIEWQVYYDWSRGSNTQFGQQFQIIDSLVR